MSDTVLFIHNILKEHVHDDELTPARARVGEARQQAFILDAEEDRQQRWRRTGRRPLRERAHEYGADRSDGQPA